jgi:hypothetical protein
MLRSWKAIPKTIPSISTYWKMKTRKTIKETTGRIKS